MGKALRFSFLISILVSFSLVNTAPPPGCSSDEFECDSGECIPSHMKCNNIRECRGGEDEEGCPCHPDEYTCTNGQCIEKRRYCDGHRDCSDYSDEAYCRPVPGPECQSYEFSCRNGDCIDQLKRCNGQRDCSDGSDEESCTCSDNQFRCSDGNCIDLSNKCNRVADCNDGGDEENCPHERCQYNQFQCQSGECINRQHQCNGYSDCADGTDEDNCDEVCTLEEFQCDDKTCISDELYCDTVPDCPDGSDERDCPTSAPAQCPENAFICRDGSCVRSDAKCDRIHDCADYSDEEGCGVCSPSEYRCEDGECIRDYQRCDDQQDCRDGSDERDCKCQSQCDDGECISSDMKCDGVKDCYDGSDERDCPVRCGENEFQCHSDKRCIPEDRRCDRRRDCVDESDERGCDPHVCKANEFRCNSGQCIPDYLRCDGNPHCNDRSDENDCSIRPEPPTQRPPEPDNNIPQDGLNLKTYPNAQIIKESREVVFQCRDESPNRAHVRWIRGNGLSLPPGSRDNKGRLEIPNIQVDQGGSYICEAFDYPSSTPGRQITVHLTVEPYVAPTPPPHEGCALSEATCGNGQCIDKAEVCDGKFDCTDGSDEMRCSPHGCEPNQFRCNNKKCVSKSWRCDGQDDCGDLSDEERCATNPPDEPCRYEEFACRSGSQCIPKTYHCDHERDCDDGSDEVGCSPIYIISPPKPVETLDCPATLIITCTATGVPTPEIVWRRNWGHVPDKCSMTSVDGLGTLTCPGITDEDTGAYSCEAITATSSKLATPDTQVTCSASQGDVCPAGFFNEIARQKEECLKCFCFGVSTQCNSADLYTFQIPSPVVIDTLTGVNFKSGEIELSNSEPVYKNRPEQLRNTGRNSAQLSQSDVDRYDTSKPYLVLSQGNFHGNQLKSYGGYLKYTIRAEGGGYPLNDPDVIIVGNGYVLAHTNRRAPSGETSVRLFEGEWDKIQEYDRPIKASREEIMMALAQIERILIKMQYHDDTTIDTTISDISLDSAGIANTGLGKASFVEQCICPAGYTGLSCEACAPGYQRHTSGPWLGHCFKPEVKECSNGFYGDPSRGIPCKVCPCPLTSPSNQFGRTCSLGSDGQVNCNCPIGYEGRRCETCSAGYTGNPTNPGDSCRKAPCNPEGSLSLTPDPYTNNCICKDFTTGPFCDQCKANSFYLDSSNRFGCISCFCMGITNDCTSSTLLRDRVSTAFTSSINDFAIVESQFKNNPIKSDISLDSDKREIVYSRFTPNRPDIYYWKLPSRFLGDKVSSYGGDLKYTLRYVPAPGGYSKNSAPDVEIVGNDVNLLYFSKDHPQPNNAETLTVPLLEQYWQRSDGLVASREHFLMALADLEDIFIKATYTTTTEETALIQVSLDTAGIRPGGARASAVEQCRCPIGYSGLSCEDCDVGYTRTGTGLYLGLCEPCACNGHSVSCDPDSGTCMNCQDNTEGDYCDVCREGYVGEPTNGVRCLPALDKPGETSKCNGCDPRGTESCDNVSCRCKLNVIGENCDQCRPGTFGLSESNIDGCLECYCSGATNHCHEGNTLSREQIPMQILDNNHDFALTDSNGENRITDGFSINIPMNEICYDFSNERRDRLFWSVPATFTGNQVTSYGGNLTLSQKYTTRGSSERTSDNDIILYGNGIKLIWNNRNEIYSNRPVTSSVPLVESNWNRLDSSGIHPASRADLIAVLAGLNNILVRATQAPNLVTSCISDIYLDTAVARYTGQKRANEVELCKCPDGYRGTSCETCAHGYFSDSTSGRNVCRRCPCSEHADSCAYDRYNRIVCNCAPGYNGRTCDTYEHTTPKPIDPPGTEPPPTIIVSISEPTIQIVDIGATVRLRCTGRSIISTPSPIDIQWRKEGGSLPRDRAIDDRRGLLVITNVQVSDSGIYICQATDEHSIVTGTASITVGGNRNEPPRVNIVPDYLDINEGEYAELRCDVTGIPLPDITWTKITGRLSSQATVQNGVLRIPSVRSSDEGEYRCTATNVKGVDSQSTVIYIRGSPVPPPPPPTLLIINPPEYFGIPSDNVILTCRGEPGIPYRWHRYDGRMPLDSSAYDGVLTIRNARIEDSGTYVCTQDSPTSPNGVQTINVRVTIEASSQPPVVSVSPSRLIISQGDSAEILCDVRNAPDASIKWTKLGESFPSNVYERGNYLHITNAKVNDRGVYVCIATSPSGITAQNSSVVEIDRRDAPRVELYPEVQQTVNIGGSVLLQCRIVGGTPQPKLSWVKEDGGRLSNRIEVMDGGILRFNHITPAESGSYICRAENSAGSVEVTGIIIVRQPPVITISPATVVHVRYGERISIECHASGDPAPNVQWINTPDQLGLPEIQRGYTPTSRAAFEIYSMEPRYEGSYTCMASNAAGTVEERVQVRLDDDDGSYPERGDLGPQGGNHVRPPTEVESAILPEDDFRIPVNGTASMSCRVLDVDGQALGHHVTREWVRADGRALAPGHEQRDGILKIYNVQPEDAGTYNCIGTSREGRVLFKAKARLTIYDGPSIQLTPQRQIVRPGDTAQITCSVTGSYTPFEIQWSAVGRNMPASVHTRSGVLQFNRIEVADAGRYQCRAQNTKGDIAESTADVIVQDYQETQRPHQRDQTAYVGANVQLRCESGAYPGDRARVRWSRIGDRLPAGHRIEGDILTLVNVQATDGGMYQCQVTSISGVTENHVNLRIDQLPQQPRLRIVSSKDNIKVGDDVDVTCTSSDRDAPIQWSKVHGRLSSSAHISGNVLRLISAQSNDQGLYRCTSRSREGIQYHEDTNINVSDETDYKDEPEVLTINAELGSGVYLECNTDIDPPIRYSWTLKGQALNSSVDTHKQILHLAGVTEKDAGRYICTVSNGITSMDIPTNLLVTGIVPHFSQAPNSYLTYKSIPQAYLELNLEISFRPISPNGMILYNSQYSTSKGGDFVSLSLSNGVPEFRFNLGGAPTVVRSDRPITMEEWHTIKIERIRKEATMYVDDNGPYTGTSLAKYAGLDLHQPLYLGGVPSYNDIAPHSGPTVGFVGCISRLVIDQQVTDLMSDAIDRHGITNCETCAESPCRNGGKCQEAQSAEGYKCICSEGFSGNVCDRVGEACYPGACGIGRCIDEQTGFKCLCPLGRTGRRCENEINISDPAFAEDAYIALPSPKRIPTGKGIKFELTVRPSDDRKDGIILYSGESDKGHGDFISLALRSGYVEFKFDTGVGPTTVIRSNRALPVGEWTRISAGRHLGEGKLIINDEEAIVGKSAGKLNKLTLRTLLYIGGVDQQKIVVNNKVGVDNGFSGCIRNVKISDVSMDLVRQMIDSANVQQCLADQDGEPTNEVETSYDSPCDNNPCQHGGHCRSLGGDQYSCSCTHGHSGRDCEIVPSVCVMLRPCQNGGTCRDIGGKYLCSCPLGFSGLHCEDVIEITTDAMYHGDGYIELSRDILPHISSHEREVIALSLSTNHSNGLVLWHGQQRGQDGRNRDYLSLAVVDGYLEFSYDLGEGAAVIRNGFARIDDGRRHNVVLKRTAKEGSIEVDGQYTEYGESKGITSTLNCDGNIFLGGAPDIFTLTGGLYTQGFQGCVHGLEIQDNYSMNLGKLAISAVNVAPCAKDDDEEDFEDSTPRVH